MNRRQKGIVENEGRKDGGQQSRPEPTVPGAEHYRTKKKRYWGRFQVKRRPVRQKQGCSDREDRNSILENNRWSAPQQGIETRRHTVPVGANTIAAHENLSTSTSVEGRALLQLH